jgi:phenylalanyl-tRNA synthetase alpha subunit
MLDIFARHGFAVHDGDELVTKHQNFYSVNIPATHPATEIHDTLYVKQKD